MTRRKRAIGVKEFSHDAILREMGVDFVSLLRILQGFPRLRLPKVILV